MAFTTVTNTFVNGATTDATAVNQNFTDILNGLSDTTKDFSMANGTLSATMTMNGNVVIGSSSSKTVNFLGSLISSVPVSANNSWDLGGSGLGFASIYLGSAGGFATRLKGSATASYTFTLPATASTSGYVMTATDNASTTTWSPVARGPESRQNYALSASVGSSAMTINLLGADLGTPSASDAVNIMFRDVTSATGDSTLVAVTGALSVVIPSGATLGLVSAVNQYIYVWAMNNAGTVELCVSGSRFYFDEGSVQSSSAIGAGSTSYSTLYGTSGRSNKAVRLLGRILSNQATSGTYASAATEISLKSSDWPYSTPIKNDLVFTASAGFGTVTSFVVHYRREYDRMVAYGHFTFGTIASSIAYIQFPSGLTLPIADTTKLPASAIQSVGSSYVVATALITLTTSAGNQTIFSDGSTNNQLFFAYQSGASSGVFSKLVATDLWASNWGISFSFNVPITEWACY